MFNKIKQWWNKVRPFRGYPILVKWVEKSGGLRTYNPSYGYEYYPYPGDKSLVGSKDVRKLITNKGYVWSQLNGWDEPSYPPRSMELMVKAARDKYAAELRLRVAKDDYVVYKCEGTKKGVK